MANYGKAPALAKDYGSGTLKESSLRTRDCPHKTDVLCGKDCKGIGSGSVTAKETTNVYK